MTTFITVIHCVTCVLLVLVVLVQSGKGAEISASFSGSSQTVFGSSGGANFFTRFTQGAAAVFMITSLTLTILGGQAKKSLFEGAATPISAPAPKAPGDASGAAKTEGAAAPTTAGAQGAANGAKMPTTPAAAAPGAKTGDFDKQQEKH